MDSSYVVVAFEMVTAGDRVDKGQRMRVAGSSDQLPQVLLCIQTELSHPDPRHIF